MQLLPAPPTDEAMQLPGIHGDARDVALAGLLHRLPVHLQVVVVAMRVHPAPAQWQRALKVTELPVTAAVCGTLQA